jgi:threonine/homoserine/homoserine lactone efflux protein
MDTNFLSTALAMAGFALATSASPGPVNIVSAMSGAKFGTTRTVPYVLGATIGFVSILAITGSGLGSIVTGSPRVVLALGLLGSAYMLYLAFAIAKASMSSVGDYKKSAPPNLVAGIVAQYSNPKAWLVSVSAISVYVAASPQYGTTLIALCGIFFVICFPSLLVWSYIGSSFSGRADRIRWFNIVMASLLALSIIVFVIDLFAGKSVFQ